MIRRVKHATTAAALLAAASLPVAAQLGSPEASLAAAAQPAIVDVYSFEGAYHCGGSCAPDGASSSNSLMLASDGNYYGATVTGGKSQDGVLFRVTPGGVYTDIHDFGFSPDGATVLTSLMEATDGNLYGVTDAGGANYRGTIFEYNLSTGAFATVYNFTIGGDSYSQLIDDGKGKLYGSTSYDGTNGLGNVFSWNYKTETYTDIYDFTNGVDGQHPWAGILIASDGRIYGTSRFGGPTDHTGTGLGDGVAWAMNTDGTGFQVIHNFGAKDTDGYSPVQGFVQGPDGNLYSTTLYGGHDCSTLNVTTGCGTLYRIIPDGAASKYARVYAFNIANGQGVAPQHGSPTLGGDGKLYIVAQQGGPTDGGQLMAFTTAGVFTDVHDFGVVGASDSSILPAAAVVEDQLGNLWGGTVSGAENQNGDVFKVEAGIAPAMTLTADKASYDSDQPVHLNWNVTNAFSDSAKVCFASSSDGSFTGIEPIAGSATVTPPQAGTITYALTCGGSQTALTTVTVIGKLLTKTKITSAPAEVVYGQTGTYNVSVAAPSGEVSGNVDLVSGGKVLAIAAVSNGVAQIPLATSGLTAGQYSIQAKFEGTSTYAYSYSGSVKLTVDKAAPTVDFVVSPGTVSDGAPAAFVVSVSNGFGTPSGSVVFSSSGQTLTSVPLTSGSGIVSVDTSKLAAGTYTITAAYGGDADDAAASATATLTIAKDTTATKLNVASSVVAGNTLTATIAVTKPNVAGSPTGTVELLLDGNVVGKASLSNSQATINQSTTGWPAGAHTLKAVYMGDAQDAASSSGAKSITVTDK